MPVWRGVSFDRRGSDPDTTQGDENANEYAERWVRSVRHELLDYTFWGQADRWRL